MSTMQLDLPDGVREFVEAQVVAGGYSSPSDYVVAVLQTLQKRRAWREIEDLVQKGLDSPLEEMTQKDWDELDSIIDRAASQSQAT